MWILSLNEFRSIIKYTLLEVQIMALYINISIQKQKPGTKTRIWDYIVNFLKMLIFLHFNILKIRTFLLKILENSERYPTPLGIN